MAQETTVKWSNFFKPTPTNLLFFVEGIKGIIATVSITAFMNDNVKIAFYVLLAGAFLDFATKFIARVEKASHKLNENEQA